MAFINPSVVNSNTVKNTAAVLASAQSGVPQIMNPLSTATKGAIANTVTDNLIMKTNSIAGGMVVMGLGEVAGSLGSKALGSVGSKVAGGLQTANNIISTANKVSGALSTLSGGYLGAALKSVTGTFSGAVTSLASGINERLGGIFANTDVKTASTTTSLISDPVKTNLLTAKPPTSSAFKISSLEAGSQSVTMSGASNQFGSNASSMIGTSLSTVLNRLNLDSVSNLASGITNAKSALSIGGLFSNPGGVVKNLVSNGIVDNLIGGTKNIAGGMLVMGAGEVLGSLAGNAANSLVARKAQSLTNDVQSFVGRTSGLVDTSQVNPLEFFLQNPKTSLLYENGDPVETNGSGVDATTGNALLEIARLIGCSPNTLNYNSANEVESLFNLILNQASQYGMDDLINSLLGCSLSTSDAGQIAVSNAFTSVAGSAINIAATLIDSITDKQPLNTPGITQSIVTNINLKSTDIADVNAVMVKIGTTTEQAYCVPGLSSDDLKIYDVTTLVGSQKSFLDGLFEDTTFSTYTGGVEVSLEPRGTVWA